MGPHGIAEHPRKSARWGIYTGHSCDRCCGRPASCAPSSPDVRPLTPDIEARHGSTVEPGGLDGHDCVPDRTCKWCWVRVQQWLSTSTRSQNSTLTFSSYFLFPAFTTLTGEHQSPQNSHFVMAHSWPLWPVWFDTMHGDGTVPLMRASETRSRQQPLRDLG